MAGMGRVGTRTGKEEANDWYAKRQAEVDGRQALEARGREVYGAKIRTGESVRAGTLSEIRQLGQTTDRRSPAPEAFHGSSPMARQMYRPSAESVNQLRRQQAELKSVTDDFSRENGWLAAPALAPVAVVAGLEGAAFVAGRLAGPQLARAPHVFTERMPHLRVGDNWATRAGRRAHAALKQKVDSKPGWEGERNIVTKAGVRRPDVQAPLRPSRAPKRLQMELKPNTQSGRRAAAAAVKRYMEETGNRTRAIFYNPKDFL